MKKWLLAVAAVALVAPMSMTSAGAMTRLSASQMDRVTAGSTWATSEGTSAALFGVAVSNSNAGSAQGFFFQASWANSTAFAAGVLPEAASTASSAAHH